MIGGFKLKELIFVYALKKGLDIIIIAV